MEVDIGRLIQEMNKNNVQKAVLLGFNAQRTLGVHVTNEYVSSICKRTSEAFYRVCFFLMVWIIPYVKSRVKKNW
jgi:hypothetical protein